MAKRQPTELRELPSAEYYLSQINLDKVAEAILAVSEGRPALTSYDFEDAKKCVWACAEAWLVRDIHDMDITGVEKRELIAVPVRDHEPRDFRGVLDVTGVLRGRLALTKKYEGKKTVIDWKTASNLDVRWRDRLVDSWQWRTYAELYPGVEIFQYRGVTREGDTREVMIEIPWTNKQEVQEQIEAVTLEQRALLAAGLEIYTRKMPGACNAYGQKCPFYEDCRRYETIPRQTLIEWPLSYSSMDRFMLCPERFRRIAIAEKGTDATDETEFGNAVHRGMAELYTQVKEKFSE